MLHVPGIQFRFKTDLDSIVFAIFRLSISRQYRTEQNRKKEEKKGKSEKKVKKNLNEIRFENLEDCKLPH